MSDAGDQTSFPRQEEDTLKRTAEAIGRAAGKIAVAGIAAGVVAGQMSSQTTILSHAAIGVSERLSRYLETHSAAEIVDDLKTAARRYPGESLVLALAFGFLVERAVLRRVMESGRCEVNGNTTR
jgi:hypothetical protein